MHQNLLADPKYKNFIDRFVALKKKSEELTLTDARALSTAFFLPPDTIYEPVYKIENVEIIGKDHNKIPLRLYIPNKSDHPLPVMLYFHRGGWVFGNIEGADPLCRKMANRFGCIVVSVEYRLAPENPFPKPLEDCFAALEWVSQHCASFGGNPEKIIISGESAGGNLAAATAFMSRDKGTPVVAAQLLFYPVIASTIKDEAYDLCVDQYFMNKDAMKFFWSMYVQTPKEMNHPYASLDRMSNFKWIPPTIVITAEYDPLMREGQEFAERLRQNGIKTASRCFPGVIHGFIDLPIYEEEQKNLWLTEILQILKETKSI